MIKPTQILYSELQKAFDHFNTTLFDGRLPECVLTLQREKKTLGYYSPAKFVSVDGSEADEIALNPSYFGSRPLLNIMQTVVHEMTHLWQEHYGKPGRGRYHNAEWADKMESIGLMPSSTAAPGGSRTGDSMSNYMIQGGRFSVAYDSLASEEYKITWADKYAVMPGANSIARGFAADGAPIIESTGSAFPVTLLEPKPVAGTRTKYACPSCHCAVWGKAALNLICGDCNVPYSRIDD